MRERSVKMVSRLERSAFSEQLSFIRSEIPREPLRLTLRAR